MKKILIFGLSSTIGGVENFIYNLYQKIDKNNYDISFLTSEHIEGFYKTNLIDKYNIKLYEIPSLKKHPFQCIKSLKRLSKENAFDVVHINLCSSQLFAYIYLLKIFSKYKFKIITHSHSSGESNFKRKILHYLMRPLLVKNTDIYLSCSNVAAYWMYGKKIVSNNKVLLINNAIDTDKFNYDVLTRNKIRDKMGYANNDFVVGHVGRFVPEKNQLFLINLLKHNKNIKLLLIGDGECKIECQQMIEKEKLDDRIIILDSNDNVNEYYQAMDLFAMPSLFEGLPIVGIEAQASGLICLFSNNITKELDITGNCFYEKLDILLWNKLINKIIKTKYKRKGERQKVKNAGYDLCEEANKISDLYGK